ncbi:MAG: type II toxin-antitoxin system RelB/DinJ family antitoxin [Succiniclasticum sp.]|jgi:DNA-damage-inducible protein J|nr:type II toxin-antitoxin system RelB/DinJ family antitoxin [Succiniclasticum sp.]MEE3479102.1 type II toxin-antitoxin system RelB/DinJ family antitoxin [Succiniclasticum sp.]
MANVSTNIKVDAALKKEAQELFSALGMDMTTAVNIFLRQAVREQGIPFHVTRIVPNQDTLDALAEVKEMKRHPENYKGYQDVDEMMKDLVR